MHSNLQKRIDGVKKHAVDRAFRQYGLSDLFREHEIAPAPPGLKNTIITTGKQIGEFGRDLVLGSPVSALEKIRKHYNETRSAPKAVGRYVKDWYVSPETPLLMKALSIGLPLYAVGHRLIEDPEHRPEALAVGAADLATAPFTSRFGYYAGPVFQQGINQAASAIAEKANKPLDSLRSR